MNENLQRLTRKRNNLVLEVAKQRAVLAETIEVLRPSIALADKGLVVIKFIKKHPFLMLGSCAVLFKVMRSHRIGKWFQDGWLTLQILRKLRNKFLA